MSLENFLREYLPNYEKKRKQHERLSQLQPVKDYDFEQKYFELARKNMERRHAKELIAAYHNGIREGEKSANQWISANDGVPGEGCVVLVKQKDGCLHIGYFNDNKWYCCAHYGNDMEISRVTGWRPI
jgi:hypothetical protein